MALAAHANVLSVNELPPRVEAISTEEGLTAKKKKFAEAYINFRKAAGIRERFHKKWPFFLNDFSPARIFYQETAITAETFPVARCIK